MPVMRTEQLSIPEVDSQLNPYLDQRLAIIALDDVEVA